MNYRLLGSIGLLVLLAAGLLVQRVWLAGDSDSAAPASTGPMKLSESGQWPSPPEFLANATILGNETPASPVLKHVPAADGLLLLAASWTYDGHNDDEVWTPECQTLPQLRRDGWTPIGKMANSEGDRYYIFRRSVHAGEKVQVQTRLRTPGYFLTVPQADIAAVMAAESLVPENRKTLLDLGDESKLSQITAPKGTVALHSPEPERLFGKDTCLGLLQRELVRQAVSIASREELQLRTLDHSLAELFSGDTTGDSPGTTLEIVSAAQPLIEMYFAVFVKQGDGWEALYDDQLRFPNHSYLELATTALEAQTRNEFVVALKRAGLGGTPPKPNRDHAAIPAEAVKLADELTLPAQFAVVRLLHEEIRQNGQSPELLAALARGYAMLGVLSDHLWSPVGKVFQARALLYTERAVAAWPKTSLPRYARAYTRALVGFHRTALEDIEAAKQLAQQAGETPPPWADTIDAFCRFDARALEAASEQSDQKLFVQLLQLLTAEFSLSHRDIVAASKQLSEAAPDCLRAIDGAANVQALGVQRLVAALGPEAAGKSLLKQVRQVPNLPDPAAKLIDDLQQSSSGGVLSRLFGSSKPQDEMEVRLKVITALREASDTEQPPRDLPWHALAQLLEEINFLHAWREVHVSGQWLGVPADGEVDAAAPLVERHRYGKFLETYCSSPLRAQRALEEFLPTVELAIVSVPANPMMQRLGRLKPEWASERLQNRIFWNDSTASDFVESSRNAADPKRTAANLRQVSPHMPYSVVLALMYDCEKLRDQLPAIEKKYASSGQVLSILGQIHAHENKPDDAVRCLEAAIKLDPSQPASLALAELYNRKGDEEKWLATLEAHLKTEDLGLGHARVQVQIADHFINKGDWKRARPYAEAAAESWAGWALKKAGQCAETMQDWNDAEKYYAALSQRYENTSWMWYEFCRRTGKGHPQQALQVAMPSIQRMAQFGTADERFRAAVVSTLAKQPQMAASLYDEVYKQGSSPVAGLYAVLQFDELGDLASRDRVLAALHEHYAEDMGGSRSDFAELAKLVQVEKAGGTLTAPDAKQLEELIGAVGGLDRLDMLFLAGWYADRAGQKDAAVDFWKRCLAERFTDPCGCTRTLAGAALLDHGISLNSDTANAAEPAEGGKKAAGETGSL
jgi:tetratricopeptide (TPR) repeat protein